MQYKIDKKVLDEFVLLAEEVRRAAGGVTETGANPEHARDTMNEKLKQMIRLMVTIKHSFNLNLIIIA